MSPQKRKEATDKLRRLRALRGYEAAAAEKARVVTVNPANVKVDCALCERQFATFAEFLGHPCEPKVKLTLKIKGGQMRLTQTRAKPRTRRERAVDTVDKVISFLENNKQQAVNRLFPHGEHGYREEWMGRDTVKFWQHLDSGNRAELVDMAVEHYAEVK